MRNGTQEDGNSERIFNKQKKYKYTLKFDF